MKKFNVLLFGLFILGFSFYGLATNSYYIQLLINTSPSFIYARTALAAALLLYVFVPSFRLYTTKNLVGLSGFLLMLLGLTSLASPTLMGYTDAYILLGDSFVLIEAGILAIVLSAELSAKRSQFMLKTLVYVQSMFTNPAKGMTYTQITNAAAKTTSFAKQLQSDNVAVSIYKNLVQGYVVPSKAPP